METKPCESKNHSIKTSTHPKTEVPIELFKNKNDTLYKQCLDCRTFHHKKYNKKDKYTESVNNNDGFIYCTSKNHLSKSTYPRDKVPVKLFMKYPENPNSPLTVSCLDCRTSNSKSSKEWKENRINNTQEDMFCCRKCNQDILHSDRAINLNKEISTLCKPCKIIENEKEQTKKIHYRNIKLDHIEEQQSCCNICNSIFISFDKVTIIELSTKIIDNIRYLEYQDKYYVADNFINLFKNDIVLEILEFDHLPEKEIRELGILNDEEIYIPKKRAVFHMCSDKSMRLEANKCQLLCGKCHLIETIKREKGKTYHAPLILKKLQHANKLKEKGCCLCNYTNNDLPRFFHFDHLDPTNKIDKICNIVGKSKYNFNDLLLEINKCRILCQHCHALHTRQQVSKGIIYPYK